MTDSTPLLYVRKKGGEMTEKPRNEVIPNIELQFLNGCSTSFSFQNSPSSTSKNSPHPLQVYIHNNGYKVKVFSFKFLNKGASISFAASRDL